MPIFLVRVGQIAVAVGVAGMAGSARAGAQPKTASIDGRVMAAKGMPVPGARVTLVNLRKTVATDSIGRFSFHELRPGPYRIQANLIGFAPLVALVDLKEGERKDVEFRTDTLGQLLPTIFVEGESQPDLVHFPSTFERRMTSGHGRFLTRENIVQRNPMKILDMIRFMPGVTSDCRGITCQVRLNHDPSGCPPAVFVDDQWTSISVLDNTPPSAIEGVEMYRGPAETPSELNNEVARCGGAIAIWTRRGQGRDR